MNAWIVEHNEEERILGVFASKDLAERSVRFSYHNTGAKIESAIHTDRLLLVKDLDENVIASFTITEWPVFEGVTHL